MLEAATMDSKKLTRLERKGNVGMRQLLLMNDSTRTRNVSFEASKQ